MFLGTDKQFARWAAFYDRLFGPVSTMAQFPKKASLFVPGLFFQTKSGEWRTHVFIPYFPDDRTYYSHFYLGTRLSDFFLGKGGELPVCGKKGGRRIIIVSQIDTGTQGRSMEKKIKTLTTVCRRRIRDE